MYRSPESIYISWQQLCSLFETYILKKYQTLDLNLINTHDQETLEILNNSKNYINYISYKPPSYYIHTLQDFNNCIDSLNSISHG
jgi:hypothetical protein